MPTDASFEPVGEAGEIDLAREGGFTLGPLRVSPSTREVQAVGRGEVIEPRVMQALVCLSRSEGQVVSRDELIRRCWGGRIVGDDAINRCIAKVRHIADLGDPPPFIIETIPRVGYRLRRNLPETPVLSLAPAAPPPSEPVPSLAGAPRLARRAWLWGLAIACVAVAALAIGWRFISRPSANPSMLSIAILPVRNLTGDPSLDAAADRLTEDVMTVDGRGSYLVAPRDATFALRGKSLDARLLRETLHVRHVLTASLRKAQGDYRVSYQLTDTTTGDVVGLGEVGAAPEPDGAFPQARLALLMFERTGEVIEPRWLHDALSRRPNLRDPDYVTARIQKMRENPRREDIPEAERLARSGPAAFATDKTLEWQFDTSACFYFEGLIGAGFDSSAKQRARWAGTALEFGRRAAELRPYTTSPHECRVYAYAWLERWDDAMAEVRHIFEAVPLSRNGYNARAVLDFDQGRFREALADYTEFAARVGGDALDIGVTHLFLNDDAAAVAELREAAVRDSKEPLAPFMLAAALERSGRHPDALAQAALYRKLAVDDRAWRQLELSHLPAFLEQARGVRKALHAAGLDEPANNLGQASATGSGAGRAPPR